LAPYGYPTNDKDAQPGAEGGLLGGTAPTVSTPTGSTPASGADGLLGGTAPTFSTPAGSSTDGGTGTGDSGGAAEEIAGVTPGERDMWQEMLDWYDSKTTEVVPGNPLAKFGFSDDSGPQTRTVVTYPGTPPDWMVKGTMRDGSTFKDYSGNPQGALTDFSNFYTMYRGNPDYNTTNGKYHTDVYPIEWIQMAKFLNQEAINDGDATIWPHSGAAGNYSTFNLPVT
jgi:hypothetical protein